MAVQKSKVSHSRIRNRLIFKLNRCFRGFKKVPYLHSSFDSRLFKMAIKTEYMKIFEMRRFLRASKMRRRILYVDLCFGTYRKHRDFYEFN